MRARAHPDAELVALHPLVEGRRPLVPRRDRLEALPGVPARLREAERARRVGDELPPAQEAREVEALLVAKRAAERRARRRPQVVQGDRLGARRSDRGEVALEALLALRREAVHQVHVQDQPAAHDALAGRHHLIAPVAPVHAPEHALVEALHPHAHPADPAREKHVHVLLGDRLGRRLDDLHVLARRRQALEDRPEQAVEERRGECGRGAPADEELREPGAGRGPIELALERGDVARLLVRRVADARRVVAERALVVAEGHVDVEAKLARVGALAELTGARRVGRRRRRVDVGGGEGDGRRPPEGGGDPVELKRGSSVEHGDPSAKRQFTRCAPRPSPCSPRPACASVSGRGSPRGRARRRSPRARPPLCRHAPA